MDAQNVYVNLVTPSQSGAQQPLREGATIFLHIIEHTGGNSYVAGFSGGRFPVVSGFPLEVGSSFLAKIEINGGKIELVPQNPQLPADAPGVKNLSEGFFGGELTPELSAYFTSLGLVPDATALRLYRQTKTLGMKFNAAQLQKAWRTAQNFLGNEKEAGDAALVLEQKGIEANAETVAALLYPFGKNSGGEQEKERGGQGSDEAAGGFAFDAEEIKRFFLGLLDGSYFSKGAAQNRCGLLSVFNSLVPRGENSANWVLLPFEFSAENAFSGSGTFRFFSAKNEKKVALSILFGGKIYDFVLYFVKDRCSKIKFGFQPELSAGAAGRFKNQLEAATGILCEHARDSYARGFCPEELPVAVVRGTA